MNLLKIAFACFLSSTLFAQEDLSLNDVLSLSPSSVTFFSLDAKQVPGNVFILDSEELETAPAMRLGELVDLVPGYALTAHEFLGGGIAVRGISTDNSAKTIFLVDDVNVNQRMHFGSMQSLQTPLIGDIKQMEVIKGPGATVHGSGALNGFVSLNRYTYRDMPQLKAKYTYGAEENLHRFEVQKGFPINDGQGVYVYAGIAKASGAVVDDQDLYGTPYTIAANSVEAKAIRSPDYKLDIKYVNHNFKWDNYFERTTISAGNSAQYRTAPTPAPADPGFAYQGYGYVDKLLTVPKYLFELSDSQNIELSAPLSLMDYGSVVDLNPGKTEKGGAEKAALVKLVYRAENLAGSHDLAIGATYGKREFEAGRNYLSRLNFSGTNLRGGAWQAMTGDWEEYSIFAEDIYKVSRNIVVVAGLRYDGQKNGEFSKPGATTDFSAPGFKFNPDGTSSLTGRLAASYVINHRNTVKVAYQRGFRAPDAQYYEWIGGDNALLANSGYSDRVKSLKNETMEQYELGHILDLPNRSALESSVYYNKYSDMIHWHDYAQNPLNLNQSTVDNIVNGTGAYGANTGVPRYWFGSQANAPESFGSIGFESTYRFHFRFLDSSGSVSYAYSRPVGVSAATNASTDLVNDDRNAWTKFPTHSIKGNYLIKPIEKLAISNTMVLYSPIERMNRDGAQKKYYRDWRALLSLNAIYEFNKKLAANVMVQNLLNNKVPVAGYAGFNEPYRYSMDTLVGRELFAGLTYKL